MGSSKGVMAHPRALDAWQFNCLCSSRGGTKLQGKDVAKPNNLSSAGSIVDKPGRFISTQINSDYRALFWNITTNVFVIHFGEIALEVISWIVLGTREYEIYESILTAELFVCVISLLISRGASVRAAAAR